MASSRKELVNVMTSRSVKRKRRRRVRGFALLLAALLCGGIALGGVNIYMARAAAPRILSREQAGKQGGYDCILVLGCLVWPDGTPSSMLQDRCRGGVELYRDKVSPVIVMSGDHGQVEYDEVGTMKQLAVDNGVPSGDIFMDHAGFTTYESLYRARDVFGAKKVLIVTQRFHLYRALYIAQKLGLEAWGFASDYSPYPSSVIWRNTLREFLARVKAVYNCVVMPKPTFLGEPIPLAMDGDVTNDDGLPFKPRG